MRLAVNWHILRLLPLLFLCLATLSLSGCQAIGCVFSTCTNTQSTTASPSSNPTAPVQIVNATLSPNASTSVPSSCPLNPNQVAQLMGVPGPEVQTTSDEPHRCSFKLDAAYIHTISIGQAHCASKYGPNSIEMETVQPHRFIVITCTGKNEMPLQNFYEAVVRFENWNLDAGACDIAIQHRLRTGPIDAPGCPTPT